MAGAIGYGDPSNNDRLAGCKALELGTEGLVGRAKCTQE
jgi:hypothetical protein